MRVLQSDIAKEQEYQALNWRRGFGRIHVIEKLDDHVEIGSNEILVLDEVPIQLPPVAGVIVAKPSTPLSHINLLAKGWGVPNAYIKNAQQLLKQYDGWWVAFETKRDDYTIKRADLEQVSEYQQRMAARLDLMRPRSDLTVRRIASPQSATRPRCHRVWRQVGESRRSDASASPGHRRSERLHDSLFYYDQFIKREQTRRRDLRTDERSEVCSRSCLPARATEGVARADAKGPGQRAIAAELSCGWFMLNIRARDYSCAVRQTRKTCRSSAAPGFTPPCRTLRATSN